MPPLLPEIALLHEHIYARKVLDRVGHMPDQERLHGVVEEKKRKLRELREAVPLSALQIAEPANIEAMASLYDRFDVGTLKYIEKNRFRWVSPGPDWTEPDLFEFIPRVNRPFEFTPPGGTKIVPRNMITDVGTIPRLLGLFSRGLTVWGYAPAFIVHDWEFELHHCGKTNKTFDQVRDTMMHLIKTLMEDNVVPKSPFNFWLVYQGIDSNIARRYWNRDPPLCTLLPDDPE